MAISRQVLMNASEDIDAGVRVAAAQELLVINLPEAADALAEALRSNQPPTVSAVLEALRNLPSIREDLLDSIVEALLVSTNALRDALTQELMRHEQAAETRLATAVTDAPNSTARENAIFGLGAFRTRRSAEALMTLLDPQREEPPAIIDAACASLSRLTGLPHGNEVARWREWWRMARDYTPDQWSRELARTLSDRIVTLERQMQAERQANQQVIARLIETYRELFASISRDEEQKRLSPLLTDPLPGMRLFAISRLERMLRDGVRIDDGLEQQVPALLADSDPQIRRRAALVMEQLGNDGFSEIVAAALPQERDPQVAAEYLGILANHPNLAMLDAVLARMRRPATTELAARAVWNLLNSPAELRHQVAGEHREAIRGTIAGLPANERSPVLLRIEAMVCTPEALPGLLVYLDGGDEASKRAVAEGVAGRGQEAIQPLVNRASDPVIYPFAINALAGAPASIESVRRVAELRPPNGQAADFAAALTRAVAALPADSLIAADDLLAAMEHITPEMRANGLAAALQKFADETPVELKVAVTMRLCPLLLTLGDHARAHELLEALNGAPSTPELEELRFKAAALAERFDRAAELDPQPASWIALVTSLSASTTDATIDLARRISEEINRRFDGQLSDEQRANLNHAISMLRPRGGGGGSGMTDESESDNATASASGDVR